MNPLQASYFGGFLDGDGSLHWQLVRQKEYKFGFYIRASMSLTQCTSAKAGLEVLQSWIGCGYLRDRGTGMSDLVVTSRPRLLSILEEVEPFVIFKRKHVVRSLELLPRIRRGLTPKEFLELAHEVDEFASLNYSKKKRTTAADVEQHLRSKELLDPVSTLSPKPKREDGNQIADSITRRPLERG